MSKLAIYKSQDASLIEGVVAGLIELQTLRVDQLDLENGGAVAFRWQPATRRNRACRLN